MIAGECVKRVEAGAAACFPDGIEVAAAELGPHLKMGAGNARIRSCADDLLRDVAGIWSPRIVSRWCGCQGEGDGVFSIFSEGDEVRLQLGHAGRFLTEAREVLVAAYTAGEELGEAGRAAAGAGRYLESYLLDAIGLVVLDKAGTLVRQMAQKRALERDWGLSPFLSPGSVHGWDLEEQSALCGLLPLECIGLSLRDDHTLRPFASIACLIGIGPGYSCAVVGEPCEVCAGRDECRIRKTPLEE